jgi:hypothetical protein
MFSARLQAYLPDGTAAGELPLPISWEASVVHNDAGALVVDYSTLTAGGDLIARPLKDGLDAALEVWNGTAWVEARGCRYLRLKQNEVDRADGSKVYRVQFVSWGWLLKMARLFGGSFTSGVRTFVAPKAGSLISSILTENANRSGIDMTVVGGGTNDAAGNPWPVLPDQKFKYGTDYFSIVRGLQEAGVLDWATQAHGLYLYQPDSTSLSPDLSATVQISMQEISEAPAEETMENTIGRVGVSADAGGTVLVEEPLAPDAYGTWEGHLAVGQVADQAAAISMGQAELERQGKARQQFTRELILKEGSKTPLVDYWPGCWITAPTNVDAEKVRLQQVTVRFSDNQFQVNLVLNDRLTETDIRRARTLLALSNGQVGSGGAPPPSTTDPEADRIPSTPTNLEVIAALVFDAGVPRGVVHATWDPVTTATDSGPLTVALYELQWSINGGDWQTHVTPDVQADIAGLAPGDVVDVRVRAVGARTKNPSNWSAIDSVTVSGDITPPSVPSSALISSRMGMVTTVWDGLSSTGQPMEDDFDHIEIALGTGLTPTTVVATMRLAGYLPIPGQTIGDMVTARFRSVDTSGNKSDWSIAPDPVEVRGVSGPDIEANSISTNALIAGSVTGEILAGLLLLGSMIATAESGQRIEMDTNGFRLYNMLEELRINLPTDPDDVPFFRGRIEADGITVREGAQFFSTLNEFAKDSIISLAEQVAPPITAPNVSTFWEWTSYVQVPATSSLGTFSLDPTQVVSASYNSGLNVVHLVQKAPGGGARVWYYNTNGTIVMSGSVPLIWDLPKEWEVTSVVRGTDGEFRIMYKWNNLWWIWDYSRASGSQNREYTPANTLRAPLLTMDGNTIWVAESLTAGPRFRRVSTSTTPVTITEDIMSTSAPSGSASPNFFYKGAADFGAAKFVVSYPGTGGFRVFSATGAYDPTFNWNPPVPKAGGFWDPVILRFRTFGTDGRMYRHTNMTWTDPALDTWHLAQTFYDGQSTGGLHETTIGTVKTFTPQKRSWVRVNPVPVPYAGGTDDPNQWRLYGKTGAAPTPSGSDMTLQQSGAYTVTIRDIGALLTTSGTAPPAVSNFPNAAPARMRSARTMPGDATKHIFEVRGDGSGRWGPLEFSNTGTMSRTDDTGWVALTLPNGWTADAVAPQVRRVGIQVAYKGSATGIPGTTGGVTVGTVPGTTGARPPTGENRDALWYIGTSVASRLRVNDQGVITMNGHPSTSVQVQFSVLNYML